MHTINIYRGARRILQISRPHFKHAWRAAIKEVRARAYDAAYPATVPAPEVAMSAGRTCYQIGVFRATPDRRVRDFTGAIRGWV